MEVGRLVTTGDAMGTAVLARLFTKAFLFSSGVTLGNYFPFWSPSVNWRH